MTTPTPKEERQRIWCPTCGDVTDGHPALDKIITQSLEHGFKANYTFPPTPQTPSEWATTFREQFTYLASRFGDNKADMMFPVRANDVEDFIRKVEAQAEQRGAEGERKRILKTLEPKKMSDGWSVVVRMADIRDALTPSTEEKTIT